MNQEEINLLNDSFNVSLEDLKALLDFVQTIIREYEKQQRLMEGLTPESPNFSATVAMLIPFMTATTTLGVLDAYTDIEADATRLQQEFARLRSLIRNHQQQIQWLTSTRTAAARKILPSTTTSPASTSGESRLVIDSAAPTPTNQNANDLEFMKKSQDLGAFLNEETIKARKRLTEHDRRQLLKDANSSSLSNIDGLDPQSKRRSWHAAIAGQGEPSANVSLVDQAAFNFPGQSAASEEARQKSMVDFCSGPLEASKAN